MQVDFSLFTNSAETIAVAVSGGGDSMALLHALKSKEKNLNIKVIALNVEHGIRGDNSVKDSLFVKDYCEKHNIPILTYTVNSLEKARTQKLTIEQAARILRYECFYDAINNGKCDKVATAHHLSDNAESVLLNIFRGTGLSGISGINENFDDKIIRPLLSVKKYEIEEYLSKNNVPFVTDETNLSDAYTRNYLRLNVMPSIKKIFPDAEKSIQRLTEIIKTNNDFILQTAKSALSLLPDKAEIKLPIHKAVFSHALILALQYLGVEKDWEKVHVDSTYSLCQSQTGSKVSLPKGIVAIKEYDKIVFYKDCDFTTQELPFSIGKITFLKSTLSIKEISANGVKLKNGFYADAGKIPDTAVIRTKRDGDSFTKFGGGTKSLGDYLTDKKIPLRVRNRLPVLANGSDILVIFGVAVSDKIKADTNTTKLIKFDIQ